MMSEQLPLPLPLPLPTFPWPLSIERIELIKAAKSRIDTPIKIIPVQPGPLSNERVLCFGALPPFLCKTIPIAPANVDSVDSIEKALRAWLDPWFPERQFAEEFTLGAWMGAEVRFSHEEDHTGKVMFS